MTQQPRQLKCEPSSGAGGMSAPRLPGSPACTSGHSPYSPRRFRLHERRESGVAKGDVKKVVLAYSGGLDTSIILKWLQTDYGCEVVTFTADLGQGEELGPAREKALLLGVKPENIFIEDLREEFVRDYVFPMFRANAVYEGQYLLGTSIARPLIAKAQIDIARKVGADAVSHGATGKGNDQVRFEVAYYALEPDIRVIAPWREWDLASEPRGCSPSPSSTRSRSPRTSAARRRSASTPTCCTPPPRARCWRTRPSRRRSSSISAPSPRRTRPTRPTVFTIGLRARRSGRRSTASAVAGGAARPGSTSSATTTASAGSTWSRTASSA